jgi:hypothetical protein
VEEVQGQPSPEPTVEEMAANVAKGILNAEEGVPETPRDEKGKFTKAQPETEAVAEQPEVPEEQPEEVVETPQEEARRLKIKYKGEEKEFLEPEVIELAQKGFDYTQKSQALAREKEEMAAKVKQEVAEKHRQYEAQLDVYRQAVLKMADPEVISADLGKMAQEDPARAFQISLRRQELGQTLQAISTEQHRLAAQRQEEARAEMQQRARSAVEILQQEIPGWSNTVYGDLMKYGVEQGFKKEEISAITDPSAFKVLWKAKQYDDLKAKPIVDKRAAAPVPKVAKPGTAEKPDASADSWNKGMAKLKQTGRSEDAVALAKMMLAREAKK